MVKYAKTCVAIALIALFLLLRFYNIRNSFFFFNDMGRDMLVLQNWHDTGKPPLLGPQTSALPFNQSAIYFYLLYPGFLISGGNPISSIFTLAFVYLFTFIFCLYLIKKYKIPITNYYLLITFYLISIHPQYIIQGRFVWNPSFVSPFVLIAILAFHQLINKYSLKLLFVFSLAIALAISLSYSVAPLLIAFALYCLIFYRKHLVPIAITLSSSFLLFNLPTLFFEIRHHFLLTASLFTKNSPVQEGLGLVERSNRLSQYIFATPLQSLNLVLFTLFTVLALCIVVTNRKNYKNIIFISSFLFLVLVFFGFTIPISIQAHYVFAYLCLIFLIVATQPKFIKIFLVVFLSLIYLNPNQLRTYFHPAPRSYSQMQSCFASYCQNFSQPTYVSVQSSFHPFHNGPEHRFLLKQAKCNVLDIETQNGQSKFMTVIVDSGTFSNQTKYYELDLFGKFKQVNSLKCFPNFEILTLEKVKP